MLGMVVSALEDFTGWFSYCVYLFARRFQMNITARGGVILQFIYDCVGEYVAFKL